MVYKGEATFFPIILRKKHLLLGNKRKLQTCTTHDKLCRRPAARGTPVSRPISPGSSLSSFPRDSKNRFKGESPLNERRTTKRKPGAWRESNLQSNPETPGPPKNHSPPTPNSPLLAGRVRNVASFPYYIRGKRLNKRRSKLRPLLFRSVHSLFHSAATAVDRRKG